METPIKHEKYQKLKRLGHHDLIACLQCLPREEPDIHIWVLTELNQTRPNRLLHHLQFCKSQLKIYTSHLEDEINKKGAAVTCITYRMIDYRYKRLQHLCHIEFYVWYPERVQEMSGKLDKMKL